MNIEQEIVENHEFISKKFADVSPDVKLQLAVKIALKMREIKSYEEVNCHSENNLHPSAPEKIGMELGRIAEAIGEFTGQFESFPQPR